MDLEQLKLILETLGKMGDAGKDAFVWWVLLDKLLPVLAWLLTFSGFLWAAFSIADRVAGNSSIAQLRDELGVGSPGPVTDYEAGEVLRKVRSLMESERRAKT